MTYEYGMISSLNFLPVRIGPVPTRSFGLLNSRFLGMTGRAKHLEIFKGMRASLKDRLGVVYVPCLSEEHRDFAAIAPFSVSNEKHQTKEWGFNSSSEVVLTLVQNATNAIALCSYPKMFIHQCSMAFANRMPDESCSMKRVKAIQVTSMYRDNRNHIAAIYPSASYKRPFLPWASTSFFSSVAGVRSGSIWSLIIFGSARFTEFIRHGMPSLRWHITAFNLAKQLA